MQVTSSYPWYKGNVAKLESPLIIDKFKCLTFQYLLETEYIGRLNVFLNVPGGQTRLVWRVAASSKSDVGTWRNVEILLHSDRAYKVE